MRPDIKVWNPENPAQWNKTLAWTTVCAIARVLVQHMGGTIHVRSVVGKGSTFSFTLRFRRPAAVLKGAESTAPGNTPAPLDGLRVLLAEDNDINQICSSTIRRPIPLMNTMS